MKDIFNKIDIHIQNNTILYIVGTISVLCWALGLELVGLIFFVTLASYGLIRLENTLPVLTSFLFVPVIFKRHFTIADFNIWLLPAIGVFVIALIIHWIKFRPKLKQPKFIFGFLALIVAFITMGIGSGKPFYFNYWLTSVGVIALLVVVYLFFNATLAKVDIKFFAKLFMTLGLVIFVQIAIYYATVDSFYFAIMRKSLHLGWAISNAIGTVLLFTIPITAYLIISSKRNAFYIIATVLQLVAMLFTFSRGAILALVIGAIPIIIYLYKYSYDRMKFIVKSEFIFIGIMLLVVFLFGPLSEVLKFMVATGFDDRLRMEDYLLAWNNFLDFPIFGTNLYYLFEIKGKIYWYHNTLLQMASSMGLVGLLAMLYHWFEKYRVIVKSFNPFNVFLTIALLMTEIHGLIDVTYFAVHFMIPLIAILLIMEKNTSINLEQPVLFDYTT